MLPNQLASVVARMHQSAAADSELVNFGLREAESGVDFPLFRRSFWLDLANSTRVYKVGKDRKTGRPTRGLSIRPSGRAP